MAFARAVIDRPLKTNVLSSVEQVERAEGRARIRAVQNEGARHPPRTAYPEGVRLGPAGLEKGTAQFIEGADQYQVHGIARKAIAGQRVRGDPTPVEDVRAEPDRTGQDQVGS